MSPHVIALGGGCDVALEFMEPLELNETTHFFDYLWNLDAGLRNVQRIIEERFESFGCLDDYVFGRHPEWNTDQALGPIVLACGNFEADQLIHRKYRDIAFIHHERNEEMASSFRRKAERFLKLLDSAEPVTFVYYRQYNAPINACYINDATYDIDAKLRYFRQETLEFAAFLTNAYPQLPFKMMSAFAEPGEHIPGLSDAIDEFFDQLVDTPHVHFVRVYRRGGEKSRKSWKALLPRVG